MKKLNNKAPASLESECMRTLSGAEYIRDKLLSLLAIGPRNLSTSAYAIKCRIKSERSLADKVLQKRKLNPTYSAEVVTDIVGLRILTILSQELEGITREFLDFIQFCQSPSVGLCLGNTPDDAIEEIIVYKSPRTTQAYDLVYSMLARRQWSTQANGQPKLQLRLAGDEKPYSSIHLVFRCVSHYAKQPKLIPVETQIRTIFEDAWNEIDHPLRYKGLQRRRGKLPAKRKRQVDLITTQIGELKIKLENCGRDAENIVAQHQDLIESVARRRRPASDIDQLTSFTVDENFNLDVSSVLRQKRNGNAQAFRDIEKRANKVISASLAEAVEDPKRSSRLCMDFVNELEELRVSYGDVQGSELDSNFEYFSRTLIALLYVWLARVEKFASGTEGLSFRDPLERGIGIYLELERDPRFQHDAFLQFRLANALLLAGRQNEASQKARDSVRRLDDDKKLKPDSIVRSLIYRRHGFLAWRERLSIRQQGQAIGSPNFKLEEQRRLLSEAIGATCMAERALEAARISSADRKHELRFIHNNLVSYCWDVVDQAADRVRGLADVQRLTVRQIDFAAIAKVIVDGRNGESLQARELDSVAKAYDLAGMEPEVRKYVDLLEKALRRPDIHRQTLVVYMALMRYTVTRLKGRGSHQKKGDIL